MRRTHNRIGTLGAVLVLWTAGGATAAPTSGHHVVAEARSGRLAAGATGAFGIAGDTIGRGLYDVGCASCHGGDGRGIEAGRRAFDVEVPDFTECSFSSREPDADWLAVVHQGGPVRAFDGTMPAFGEAFTEEQILQILAYIRTFCGDDAWPRGELNLPRALVTEKAYPEDEAVTTLSVDVEGPVGVINEVVYEKRFGPRNQVEVKLPFGVREQAADGSWAVGLGDIAVGFKRALLHGLANGGSILSAGAEVVLPTGKVSTGFGGDEWIVEPFVLFGKVLPADAFLHAQALAELPVGPTVTTDGEADGGEGEAGVRLVVGRTWTQGRWGRAWSPMVELLAARAFESGATVAWDIVPQFQVTLNTRQHVMANLGVRVPLTDADVRQTTVMLYLLWDWFDGGFFDGW